MEAIKQQQEGNIVLTKVINGITCLVDDFYIAGKTREELLQKANREGAQWIRLILKEGACESTNIPQTVKESI